MIAFDKCHTLVVVAVQLDNVTRVVISPGKFRFNVSKIFTDHNLSILMYEKSFSGSIAVRMFPTVSGLESAMKEQVELIKLV